MPTETVKAEFVSRKTLAALLDVSESTVDELTRKGVLPRPYRLSGGVVRWHWANVVQALVSLQGASHEQDHDPAMVGVRKYAERIRAEKAAAKATKKGG